MDIVKCRIADFNISFENDIKSLSKIMRDYLSDFDKEDILLSISDEEIEYERTTYGEEIGTKYLTSFKITAFFRKLGEMLPNMDSFVLHSACFDVDGVGVAFAAHSGTGKTTHMRLWREYLGDRMIVVNGDKPIVRFFDDSKTPYAYGTPWNGKEHLGRNMRTPLKHICFIERSETNYVEQMDKKDAIARIFKQVYIPRDPIALAKTSELIDKLLAECKLWIIHCNMDISAAETAYKTIFGK